MLCTSMLVYDIPIGTRVYTHSFFLLHCHGREYTHSSSVTTMLNRGIILGQSRAGRLGVTIRRQAAMTN